MARTGTWRQGALLALVASHVAASTLPFAPECQRRNPSAEHMLAVDPGGTLYAVALCNEDVQVTTSSDDGANWSPPLTIGTTAVGVTVTGGPGPGQALVAWIVAEGVMAAATTNGGASFAPAVRVFDGFGGADTGFCAVTRGSEYHVLLSRGDIPFTTARSLDGGQSWLPAVNVDQPSVFGDLLSDATTGNLYVVSDLTRMYESTSVDGGASYSSYEPLPGPCCTNTSDAAIGCNGVMYVVGEYGLFADPDVIRRYRCSPRAHSPSTSGRATAGSGSCIGAGPRCGRILSS